MREQLSIIGTSFIPNFKDTWESLDEHFELDFLGIGDWNSILGINQLNRNLVCIYLQEDYLFQTQETRNIVLLKILETVRERLKKSHKPIIFCFSLKKPVDIISVLDMGKEEDFSNLLRAHLKKLRKENSHFYPLDLDFVLGEIGHQKAFNNRNWYFAHSRLTRLSLRSISNSCSEIFKRIYEAPKKVMVLDCDNTLWGGVIGEDGINGILLGSDGLGAAYQDFQRAILRLWEKGTLIALASKNNQADVWEVFDTHPCMILRREHVISSRINWEPKHVSINSIAAELNLGLESIVFWDDNPIERSQIQNHLPLVSTIAVPNEVVDWPHKLLECSLFTIMSNSEEDSQKHKNYEAMLDFRRESENASNPDDFLKSISLRARINPVDKFNIQRAEQLSIKTNQFNARAVRYSSREIESLIEDSSKFAFMVDLKDIFGFHGNVFLVILNFKNRICFIDTFAMSCRVFGRKLELWVLEKIIEICKSKDVSEIIFEFVPNPRNRELMNRFFSEQFFLPLLVDEVMELQHALGNQFELQSSQLYRLSRIEFKDKLKGLYNE